MNLRSHVAWILFIGFGLHGVALADDIRVVRVSGMDGESIVRAFARFLGNPERVVDANNPLIWHVKRRYQAKTEALGIECSTLFVRGTEGMTECSVQFNLSRSTPELEVFEGKLAGALAAKFNTSTEATLLNGMLSSMPLVSAEKVNIRLSSGVLEPTPRLRIDCDTVPNSGGVAKNCVLVAIPDQDYSIPNLGLALPLKANGTKPGFSATYTYGDDPDGSSYLLTASPHVSPADAVKSLRWNFYLSSSNEYLLAWDDARSTKLAMIQIMVREPTPANPSVVNQILNGQKRIDGQDELYFVLADQSNTPQYNLPISAICSWAPASFKDLTQGKKCDEFALP